MTGIKGINVLLVGGGKMGGALADGWRAHGMSRKEIVVVDPVASAIRFRADVPARFRPHVVVFAVKPQVLPDMIEDYRDYAGDALFISIAAGKPISFFEQNLGGAARIVRSMPNTPAAIGKGITVACANRHVTATDKGQAAQLLGAVGDVLWVEKEQLLNPVTALSGSGPAYLFLLIEVLTQAGIMNGLDAVMAGKLARQTVIGSALLAESEAKISPSVLRQNVTSPGGTTEAALRVLMGEHGLQELFTRALAAATKRAEELSA